MTCTWLDVHPDDPQTRAVCIAVRILATGVVCLPSDAGYVLACRAGDKRSVSVLRRVVLRRRWSELTVLCRDVRQLAQLAPIDDRQFSILKRNVPGPHTFIVGGPLQLPRPCWARNRPVRVRIPSHRVLRAVIEGAQEPLACAAAPQGHSCAQACCTLDECTLHVGGVLDAGVQPLRASSVIDLTGALPQPLLPAAELTETELETSP